MQNLDWTEDMVFFRRIAENANILAWITGTDGSTVYLSPGWYTFTGTKPTVVEAFGWLTLIHPDDRAGVRRAYFKALDNEEEYGASYRLKTRTGDYQMVWGHGVPRRDCDLKFCGYFGMTQTMDQYVSKVESLAAVHAVSGIKQLSPRETEVIRLAAEGYSNDQIAVSLDIAIRTVEDHVKNAVHKLKATNRVHAVVKAIKLNAI